MPRAITLPRAGAITPPALASCGGNQLHPGPTSAWQRVPEGQNGTKSSCLQPCVPAGHASCPCVPCGHGPALQPDPAGLQLCSPQGLTGHSSLQSGEGFWLTLAGSSAGVAQPSPPKRGAGGQSSPQAWVEVDPEETPPPREPTCYCRNSQRNSRLG